MKRLFTAVGAFVFVLTAVGMAFAQDNPFVGTWKMNPAKEKITGTAANKEQTAIITVVGDQLQVDSTGTRADGSSFHETWQVPLKGGAGKYLVGPNDQNISMKVINEKSEEFNVTRGGKEVVRFTTAVSKDGKSTTVTFKGIDDQGKPFSGVAVYEKQ